MLRRNSGFENYPNCWGIAELSRRQESTENGAEEQPAFAVISCHMYLLRKGRSACLLPTRHSVQLWRPPDVNNNREECKSHSGHAQVHAQTVSTMAPLLWHATPDGQ